MSMIVLQVAAEGNLAILSLQPSNLMSKWSGESEKSLRAAFEAARLLQPCIIFIVSVSCRLACSRVVLHVPVSIPKIQLTS